MPRPLSDTRIRILKRLASRDLVALRILVEGGAITDRQINRLRDLGLVGYEARTRLKGTTMTRTERVWLKASGRSALAEAEKAE